MRITRPLLLAALAASLLPAPALAAARPSGDRFAMLDRPRDQDRAFRAAREGRSMPLPMLERKVRPHIGDADYLGPELRGGDRYRLKYMQRGRVIWVDVDAATGRILDRSGD